MTIKDLRDMMEENGGFYELNDGRWISDYANKFELHEADEFVEAIGFGRVLTEEEVMDLVNEEA